MMDSVSDSGQVPKGGEWVPEIVVLENSLEKRWVSFSRVLDFPPRRKWRKGEFGVLVAAMVLSIRVGP